MSPAVPRFHPDKVVDVETLPCPAGGLHVLVNVATGVECICSGCGVSWADLDAAVRAARPRRV